MGKLEWDKIGERRYETGVDHVVLYKNNGNSAYAWNGITGITENPSGAEPSILWANNKKYMTLMSVEQLGLTIEAYTYPNEFLGCIGKEELSPGVLISQQEHEHFGLSYRTLVGNDERGNDYAYKVHLVYNCLASPTEENHASTSDSPDISPFSWEIDTTPVEVENRQSTSKLTFSSSDMKKAGMANDKDVALVKYVGRKRPVSYYGTQLGETSSWKMEVPSNDEETLYALRRLAVWMGDVYAREPSGTGYWAHIKVSISQTHCALTIPVSIELTRVEGGA